MKCTGKEWDTCRVEKMGCKGCHYDDIEIGEHIRNKSGYIDKVIKIIEKDEKMHNTYYCCESVMASSYKEEIVKHSKNIIDLIEVGDILEFEREKYEVIFDESYEKLGILRPSRKELAVRHSALFHIFNTYKNIKILTKEQFAENCYEI